MVFDVIARDSASGSFKRIGAEAEGAGKSMDRLGKAAAGISVAFAAFAVNAAAKFESSMTRISTQAGVPIGQIKALGDSLLKLSPKVGFNPDELATSLYHVESAFRTTGITAGKAIDIVAQASKLAKIGNADLEDTTQAIIGTLSSKIKGVKDAADAAAQLNQLVGTGDTTLSAVVKAVGTGILPTAQALGLSFKDISAGLATLSDNATPIDEAATRFRTTLSLVEKPSQQAKAALESIGLTTTALAEDFRRPDGLLVAMEDLKGHLDKTFPLSDSHVLSLKAITAATSSYKTQLLQTGVSQKTATDLSNKFAASLKAGGSAATLQAQTILQAFGGAKSGATFLTLFEELDRLKSKYADAGTSAQAAAKFQEAWVHQQQTARQKLDELKASWDKFLIQAGNEILPTLKTITDLLAKHPGIIQAAAAAVGLLAAAWVGGKVARAIKAANSFARAILSVGAASTTAAAESEAAAGAAAAGGAAAGAGAGAAEGAAAGGLLSRLRNLKLPPLLKIAIPVAVTLGAIKVLGLEKSVKDLMHGQIGKEIEDSPEWEKSIAAGLGRGLKATKLPGTSGLFTGNLTGELIGDFAKNTKDAKDFWPTLDDKARIADFQSSLKNIDSLFIQNNHSLVGNTYAAKTNRAGLVSLVNQAKSAAAAYSRTTGKQSDYTAALNLAIPVLEAKAQAEGFNKQQIEAVVGALLSVPKETPASVILTGTREALASLADLEANLRAIAKPINIPIQVQSGLLGVASPNFTPTLPQILTAQGSGFGGGGFGGSGPGGIPGGTGHARGGIARGWSWIGEKGPELVNFGSPSRVLTHEDSLAAVGGMHVHNPNITVNNNVDARELAQQVGASVRMAMRTRRV
jgi:TP901 family phage tail tape measure protein